jgi:hypothetical protein
LIQRRGAGSLSPVWRQKKTKISAKGYQGILGRKAPSRLRSRNIKEEVNKSRRVNSLFPAVGSASGRKVFWRIFDELEISLFPVKNSLNSSVSDQSFLLQMDLPSAKTFPKLVLLVPFIVFLLKIDKIKRFSTSGFPSDISF